MKTPSERLLTRMFSFLSDAVLTEVMVYEDMVSAVDPNLVIVYQKTRDR